VGGSRPRVAVLDDDETFAELMQAILEEEGYDHVSPLSSGTDPVEALAAAHVDVAVLDLRGVSEEGGLGLLNRIRSRLQDLPILVCSADVLAMRRHAAEIATIPHVATLEKPFRIDALTGALLRLREGASQATAVGGRTGRPAAVALEHLLERTARSLRWAVAEAWIADLGPGLLRCAAGWASSDEFQSFVRVSRRTRLPIGSGVPGRVWVSGRAAWITDLASDMNRPRLRTAQRVGLVSAAAVPVVDGGEVVGVVAAYDTRRRPHDAAVMDRLHGAVEGAAPILRAAAGLQLDPS